MQIGLISLPRDSATPQCCRAEVGEAGEVTKVVFLILGFEEQTEHFRPGLRKEIGERVHLKIAVALGGMDEGKSGAPDFP